MPGAAPPRPRHAARILLRDGTGRVLLIRFVIPRASGPFAFWATPGGEIEPGETPQAAARRELREELGLDLPVHGPVHHASAVFEFAGRMVANHDSFFTARFDPETSDPPRLAGVDATERAVLREIRWFDAAALASETLPVFPEGLAGLLAVLPGTEAMS